VQNEAHAIVGWKIVDIPASRQFTNTYQSVVKSSELGVSGLIYQCWLT
jgi:capsular polysaccharide biosynthesis protein